MISYKEHFNWWAENAAAAMMADAYGKVLHEYHSGKVGYYTLPETSVAVIEETEALLQRNAKARDADTIVVIGIGGSSLGTKAVHALLRYRYPEKRKMLFLENPDPVEISEKLTEIDPGRSLFLIVSKSGSTIETTSIFKEVLGRYAIDLESEERERFIAITDEGSVLWQFAECYGLEKFAIPHNVGGRFSVLSSVGIVPLTLAGYDCRAILKGGREMVERFFRGEANHITEKAAFLVSHRTTYGINVLFSYGSYLEDFTKWYVQLWGESLGKIDRFERHTGMTPVGHIGSVDQHSFLQLIIEGPRDKTVTFIKIEDFENPLTIPDRSLRFMEKTDYINGYTFNDLIDGECEATKRSVMEKNIPVDEITLDRVSEENIGELLLYFELLTSLCGAMLHIDTYDQPGVELGKRILVETFTKKGK